MSNLTASPSHNAPELSSLTICKLNVLTMLMDQAFFQPFILKESSKDACGKLLLQQIGAGFTNSGKSYWEFGQLFPIGA